MLSMSWNKNIPFCRKWRRLVRCSAPQSQMPDEMKHRSTERMWETWCPPLRESSQDINNFIFGLHFAVFSEAVISFQSLYMLAAWPAASDTSLVNSTNAYDHQINVIKRANQKEKRKKERGSIDWYHRSSLMLFITMPNHWKDTQLILKHNCGMNMSSLFCSFSSSITSCLSHHF